MSVPQRISLSRGSAIGIAGALLIGLLIGLSLAGQLRPPPRDPALLWDDYILTVAALYQREGDLAAAQQRLAKLPTEDPVRSVVALATVYTPEPDLGEEAASALRKLAADLSGQPVPAPAAAATTADQSPAAPGTPFALLDPLLDLARNQFTWIVIIVASTAWLVAVWVRDRRRSQAAQAALAPAEATLARAVAGGDEATDTAAAAKKRRSPRRLVPRQTQATQPMPTSGLTGEPQPVLPPAGMHTLTFSYRGGTAPFEEMVPISDPATGRPIAGCGMSSGPSASGPAAGYLGFLIWLHELGSHEMPQTVGLVAEGAAEQHRQAIAEWAAYAHLDELVVARPGIVRSFETRRLRAAVSVTEMAHSSVGRQRLAAFSRLAVRVDLSFKDGRSPARLSGSSDV